MTLPVRRLVAALVLGGALVTSGCGVGEANRAAVVDGRVIPETEVQSVVRQFNSMKPAKVQEPLTPAVALTALVQSGPALEYLEGKGIVSSRSVAEQDAQSHGISDPSDGTIEVLRFIDALDQAQKSSELTAEDQAAFSKAIADQTVEVNPRYGTFDKEQLSITSSLPQWVKPYDAR